MPGCLRNRKRIREGHRRREITGYKVVKYETEQGLGSHWKSLPLAEVRSHWKICVENSYVLTASAEAPERIHYMGHEKCMQKRWG